MGNCALLPAVRMIFNHKKAIHGVFAVLEFNEKGDCGSFIKKIRRKI